MSKRNSKVPVGSGSDDVSAQVHVGLIVPGDLHKDGIVWVQDFLAMLSLRRPTSIHALSAGGGFFFADGIGAPKKHIQIADR